MANFDRSGSSTIQGELGTGFASLRFPAYMGREAGNNFVSDFAVDCGPFFYDSKRYCVLWDTVVGGARARGLMVLASSDGLVWDELDTTNAPESGQTYQVLFDDTAGILHVAYRNDGGTDVAISTFDLDTGTWGSEITGGPSLGAPPGGLGGSTYILTFGRRSDGSYVVAYRISVSGTPFDKSKVRYAVYDDTGSPAWGTPIDIDPHGDADSRFAWPVGLWVDADDRTHVMIVDSTGDGTVHHRSIDFDDTVNGVTTLTYGPSHEARVRFGPARAFDGRMLIGMQEDVSGDSTVGYPALNYATLSGVSPTFTQVRASETDLLENDIDSGYPDVAEIAADQFYLIWSDDALEDGNNVTNIRRAAGDTGSPAFDEAETLIRQYERIKHISARTFGSPQRFGMFYSPDENSLHVRYFEDGPATSGVFIAACVEGSVSGSAGRSVRFAY